MRLIHYSAEPFNFEHRRVEQPEAASFPMKPQGLWVSVKGETDWAEQGREMFGDGGFHYASLIELTADANILRLSSVRQIDSFTEQYRCAADPRFPSISGSMIDWRRVAEQYQGIIIAPYQFERRLTPHTFWYYGWDCASGCIWNTAAVASVEALVEDVA